jgi:hypothetical protein
MSNPIALTQETYDKFDRAASVIRGGVLVPQYSTVPGEDFEILKVSSSTIGTYGYPAKFQIFDPSAGTWSDDSNRPQTVYLIDPAGGAYTSGQYADARFLCYRGAANESVYVAVKQSSGSTLDFSTGSSSVVVATLAGAGVSPTASITGSRYRGVITVNTGNTPIPNGLICTVTISPAFTNTIPVVVLSPFQNTTPPNSNLCFALPSSSSVFTVQASSPALVAFVTYQWGYTILNT